MKEKYDVVIIGAGIGGLVCGCYLAKAGLKTLIVEQHDKPGGYCTSFSRSGYRFDVGVHYFGGVKKRFFGNILKELKVDNAIKFDQFDPTDKIILPDNITYIRSDYNATMNELKKSFPKEKKGITGFFTFIMQDDFLNIYRKVKQLTFQELLDEFFEDYRLKATIEAMLYNIGISAKRAPALCGIILYRDYIFDPGHYPIGGMQKFPDVLAALFKKFGGHLILGKMVTKVLASKSGVHGVSVDNKHKFYSQIIIANCDATQVFSKLLKDIKSKESRLIKKLEPSPALFVIYIGLNKDLQEITDETCNIWKFNSYELDEYFTDLNKSLFMSDKIPFTMISFPSSHDHGLGYKGKSTVQLFMYAPFKNEDFWKRKKDWLANRVLENIKDILPDIGREVDIKTIASPTTFYQYTLNKSGAAYGWSSTIEQSRSSIFPSKTSINGLFFTGHWCTTPGGQGGIPKVAFSGRQTAQSVVQNFGKKWVHGRYDL